MFSRAIALPMQFSLCLLLARPSLTLSSSPEDQETPELTVEETVVSATRADQALADIPAHTTLLFRGDLRQTPAQTADELLQQIPGFSLFRRAGSAVAHPTAQGVSLRGVGASGASRTLVLLDGIPLNDPFGGWVQWSRVRPESLERVEVLRGAGAHLWGNYALGGVINLVTAPPQKNAFALSAQAGDRRTASLDLSLARVIGATGLVLEAGHFTTRGYPTVRADQRGRIDTEANSQSQSLCLKIFHPLSPWASLSLHSGLWREERDNGTPLSTNSTRSVYAAGTAAFKTAGGHRLNLRAFAQAQGFESSFSSASLDRNSEAPALDQFDVPARTMGASLEWTGPIHAVHLLAAGADLRWVRGETNEDFRFMEDRFTRRRRAGGQQQLAGLYLQDTFIPHPRLHLVLGARLDGWRSFSALRREQDLDTHQLLRDQDFPDRDLRVFNPRAGLLFKVAPRLSLRAALYRAFRAPTLNELFRPFRVRNDLTEARETLDPERLRGAEAGLDYLSPSLDFHLTGYWDELADAVANLTVGQGPGQVDPCGFVPAGGMCRQRGNLEQTRVRGLEAEAGYRPALSWSGSVGYLFTQARLRRAPPELEGKRPPQVPAHSLTLKLTYAKPALALLSLQGRYTSAQFEDDLNTRRLKGFAVLDFFASRPLQSGKEVFFQVENLLDQSCEAGISGDGIVTVGAPRRFQGGLRVELWN